MSQMTEKDAISLITNKLSKYFGVKNLFFIFAPKGRCVHMFFACAI